MHAQASYGLIKVEKEATADVQNHEMCVAIGIICQDGRWLCDHCRPLLVGDLSS